MRRVLLAGAVALVACNDTIPGLCKVDNDCPGSTCRDGVCRTTTDAGLNILGASCASGSECASGSCADGVCCDAPCNDKVCQRCDSASVADSGHCGIAQAGTDLDHECAGPVSTCSGKCSIARTTASCSGTSYTCATQQATVPIPSGQVCSANAIVPVSKDDYCNSGNDCAEGQCQATQWWTSCDGQGNCRKASDSTDAATRTLTAIGGASLTSACETNGGSFCGAACVGDATYSAFCNGEGQCVMPSSTKKNDCANYTCNASTATCNSQCTVDLDCAQAFECAGHVCHWDWEWPDWALPLAQNLVVNADGATVTDISTTLVWQRGTSDSALVSTQAATYCASLVLSGGSWRLPTTAELLTIVDAGRSGPAINTTAFPGTKSDVYWASTPYIGRPTYAWGVRFSDGSSGPVSTGLSGWVRCVR